jgi:hypothetical protein
MYKRLKLLIIDLTLCVCIEADLLITVNWELICGADTYLADTYSINMTTTTEEEVHLEPT